MHVNALSCRSVIFNSPGLCLDPLEEHTRSLEYVGEETSGTGKWHKRNGGKAKAEKRRRKGMRDG